MKKRVCILFLLTVFSVGFLSAKVKLTLDVGPVYTHFDNYRSTDSKKHIRSANLGGLDILLRCEFAKHFGVYGMTNFAFGNRFWDHASSKKHYEGWLSDRDVVDLVYAIDSQFGFFYAFTPAKNLEIMLGFGLGLGGNGYNLSYTETILGKSIGIDDKKHCTNIGGGINVDVSYMFTKMVGIYGGISDTLYLPVSVRVKTNRTGKEGSKTYSGADIQNKAGIGRLSNSLSIKAGIQFVF